ncbi:fatty acid synthase-like isoform X2 [Periplaneta americana]
MADVEEMRAVDAVLLKRRRTPLLVGSVKSNMGHSNAAANLCSVAKVLIAMQTGMIPPTLHYHTPAVEITALTQGRAKVVTESTPWHGGLVALNSMGMTGTYAHTLLRSYSREKSESTSDSLPRLILLSSRTEQGVREILRKLESMPVDAEMARLLHDVYSTNIAKHLYRCYTVLPSAAKKPVHDLQHYDQSSRPVWFVFSGMGSQWPGMGRELMRLPVCATTIDKCHDILKHKGLDLKHIITTDDPHVFDSILHCFVGIAAVQLALVDLLNALGITADGFLGHSVGELGCAYADSCFTQEQMILAAYHRGRASFDATLIEGCMAAVGIGHTQLQEILPSDLDIACHNSSDNCTISGPAESVKRFVDHLQHNKIFARSINVANIAYHSRYIKPAAPLLLEALQKLIPEPKPRSSRWICTSVPEESWDSPLARYCSAEYHTNNLLNSVLFEEASRHIPKNAITIEVAPYGLLQAILHRSLGPDCTHIALTRRAHPQGLHFLLSAIGKMYLVGLLPQVRCLYPAVQLPVSRGTPSISPFVRWDHTDSWYTVGELDISELISGEQQVSVSLNQEEYRAYAGHVINGHILFPAFAFLKMVWDTVASLKKTVPSRLPVVFEDVYFLHQLYIEERGTQELSVLVQRGSGMFEISSDKTLLVTGRVHVPDCIDDVLVTQPPICTTANDIQLTSEDLYLELEQYGYNCSHFFRAVKHVTLTREGCVANLQWTDSWVVLGEALMQLVMLHSHSLQLPAGLQKVVINPLKCCDAPNQELEATFHYSTEIMRCGIIELMGFKTAPSLSLQQDPSLSLEAIRFVTHGNTDLQSPQQFFAVSLQLAMENSPVDDVTVIAEANLAECMKPLLPHFTQVTLHCNSTKDLRSGDVCNVLAVPASELWWTANVTFDFLLMRVDAGDTWHEDPALITVAVQHFDVHTLVLLRKAVAVDMHATKVLHLSRHTSTWLQQLEAYISSSRVYAVVESDLQGLERVFVFCQQMNKKTELKHVRFMFVLDRCAPTFSLKQEMLHRDLLVNVLYTGQWGGFYRVPLDSTGHSAASIQEAQLLSLQSMSGVRLSHVGLDMNDTGHAHAKLSAVEFSGCSESGQRLMGVASASTQVLAPHLTWCVPESWSLEDAATVPLAYAIAYYSLMLAAELKSGETVLVHEGWHAVGLAAIVLALDRGCTVFTTAATLEQKVFIQQCIPQLAEEQILSCEDTSFETRVKMATDGTGAQVVLSRLLGSRLHASLHCLARHGRFVQLGWLDNVVGQSIGMEVFQRNTDMFTVTAQSLFSLTRKRGETLHKGIQAAIQRGVVHPLPCSVFPKHQAQLALRVAANESHTTKVVLCVSSGACIQAALHCGPCEFYLVIGLQVDECLDVVEWLVSRGVHRVAIAVCSRFVPSQSMTHRIDLLHSYHKARVELVEAEPLHSANSIPTLLEKACSVFCGELVGLFVLPVEPVGQENCVTATTVANLDAATCRLSLLRHFVCLFMEDSWGTCEVRHQAGLPALAVLWPHRGDGGLRLSVLDQLLGMQDSVIIVQENRTQNSAPTNAGPALHMLLPASLQQLTCLGDHLLSDTSCLVELPSLSPGYSVVKEVPPVFVIPGLQGLPSEVLQPLVQRLMYPVLCARLMHGCTSIPDMAATLIQHVLQMQDVGPYNLLGVSWGGALALELARQLECRGHKTRVVIIDGAPETMQATVRQLDEKNSLETSLVARLLQCPTHKLAGMHSGGVLTTETMAEGIPTLNPHVSAALTTLKDCLAALLQYSPSGVLLQGDVTLVRPSHASEGDSCGLDQFFKQTVRIHLVPGDHLSCLASPRLHAIVNDFIL